MNKLKVAITAAVSGGNLLKEHYGKVFKEKQKESLRDIVTEIDELSENTIVNILQTDFPNETFLTEESGLHNKKSKGMWIVDALDGTVNYIHGIPMFCVSISYWRDMIPEIGVVFNPISGDLYYAQNELGAFLNQQKIKTSPNDISKNLCAMAFSGKAHNPQERFKEFELFGQLNDFSQGCLRTGSAAINLSYLAQGKFGLAVGKANKLWDIAAGIIIAKEAGIKVKYKITDKENFLVDYIAGSESIINDIQNNIDISYIDV
jgi:myo-inositol-1(or 4)-monophosphatase